MVGRLGILKARETAKTLGDKFNLKDFHFQVSNKFFVDYYVDS